MREQVESFALSSGSLWWLDVSEQGARNAGKTVQRRGDASLGGYVMG